MENELVFLFDQVAKINASHEFQYELISEEMGEFLQAKSKLKREKGSLDDITIELIDVLTTIMVYFTMNHVTDEYIRDRMIYKLRRAINRYNTTGKR